VLDKVAMRGSRSSTDNNAACTIIWGMDEKLLMLALRQCDRRRKKYGVIFVDGLYDKHNSQ